MKLSNRLKHFVHPIGMPSDIEQIFEHFIAPPGHSSIRGFEPRTDIEESDTDFVVTMELPGLNLEQVNVEVAEGRLTISGEKTTESQTEGNKYHYTERASGHFKRSFEFPTQVDFEKVNAQFDKGELKVILPKSEKVLPRKIEVQLSK